MLSCSKLIILKEKLLKKKALKTRKSLKYKDLNKKNMKLFKDYSNLKYFYHKIG